MQKYFFQYGYTLFEILIAMALSVLFVMSSYQILYSIQYRRHQQQVIANNTDIGLYLNHYFNQKLLQTEKKVQAIKYLQLPAKWRRQLKKNTDLIEIIDGENNHARFFIAKTNRYNEHHKMLYALYKKYVNGRREEILPGINDLKIKIANSAVMQLSFGLQYSAGIHWPIVLRV